MIPFDDRGLTLGDGLFETVLAIDGHLVGPDAHLARMGQGAPYWRSRRRTTPPRSQ